MATASDARRDLALKLALERKLAGDIRLFNKKLVRQTVRSGVRPLSRPR